MPTAAMEATTEPAASEPTTDHNGTGLRLDGSGIIELPGERLLPDDAVCALFGVSKRTLLRLDAQGKGPPRYKFGKTNYRKESEILPWITSNKVQQPDVGVRRRGRRGQ